MYFSAARSFDDCVAFCAAQNFPHFQYGTADGAIGTCACCNSDATETSVGGTSVYTYAESKVEVSVGSTSVYTDAESKVEVSVGSTSVAESAQTGSAIGSAHPIVPYLLHVIFLPFLC